MAKIKLTQKFCSAVRHSGSKGHESYSDTELTGFYLEVRKSGGKTFSLRYQQNKKRKILNHLRLQLHYHQSLL